MYPPLPGVCLFVLMMAIAAPLPAYAQHVLASLPQGLGLAAQYPGDVGIASHPHAVFVEGFEVTGVEHLQERWSTVKDPMTLRVSELAPVGSPGSRSLQVIARRGENTGGYVFKVLDDGYDKLHMRFYVRFAADHPYSHHFVRMGGRVDAPPYPLGGAGKRPEDHFSVGLDAMTASGNTYPAVKYSPPGVWGFYNYWPEMRSWQTPWGDADPTNPSYYGNTFHPRPPVPIPREAWICVEIMAKVNSTPEVSDGELALWIDGRLVAHYAPGSIAGYWVRDAFRTDPTNMQSRPFTGFRWRNDTRTKLRTVKLENYLEDRAYEWTEAYLREHLGVMANTKEAIVWFDHLVVATEYIGPMGASASETHKGQEEWK